MSNPPPIFRVQKGVFQILFTTSATDSTLYSIFPGTQQSGILLTGIWRIKSISLIPCSLCLTPEPAVITTRNVEDGYRGDLKAGEVDYKTPLIWTGDQIVRDFIINGEVFRTIDHPTETHSLRVKAEKIAPTEEEK